MHALFAATSARQLDADHPTGLWLEELAVPYMAAIEAGIQVTVASPLGGAVPLDPKTLPDERQRRDWAPALEALQHSVTLASVQHTLFDAIFLPGGHGPLVDLVHDSVLQGLLTRHDAAGKVIAAVCHGPAGLLNARRADGQPLLQGRRVTGFTNTEELLSQLKSVVPFLLEDELKARGADFHSALLPMLSHVEEDGHFITGQNPRSSEALAQALVKRLTGR